MGPTKVVSHANAIGGLSLSRFEPQLLRTPFFWLVDDTPAPYSAGRGHGAPQHFPRPARYSRLIPARHNLYRRVDANDLARLVPRQPFDSKTPPSWPAPRHTRSSGTVCRVRKGESARESNPSAALPDS